MGNKNSRSLLIRSRVVPFFPGLWSAGLGGVAFDGTAEEVDNEEDDLSHDAVVVPF